MNWSFFSDPQLVDTAAIVPIAEIPNVGTKIDFKSFAFFIYAYVIANLWHIVGKIEHSVVQLYKNI